MVGMKFRVPSVLIASFMALMFCGCEQSHEDKVFIADLKAKAEFGDAESQFWLGDCYLTGYRVPLNFEEAKKWLRLAAYQGDPYHQYALAKAYDGRPMSLEDYKESIDMAFKSADQGFAPAEHWCGLSYRLGEDWEGKVLVPVDDVKAFAMFVKSAQKGYWNGMVEVAECYEFGWGIAKSMPDAFAWYHLALLRTKSDLQKEDILRKIELLEQSMTKNEITESKEIGKKIMVEFGGEFKEWKTFDD